MEDINLMITDSIDYYFSLLQKTGYMNQYNVDSLLILIAVGYILNNFQEYITDKDIRSIMRAILCIGGTCLIGCHKIKNEGDSLLHSIREGLRLRESENSVFRITQNKELRAKL